MNQIVFLFLILVLAVGLPLFFKVSSSFNYMEGYSNYTLDGAMGNYPEAQTDVLLQDTYKAIGKNEVSNDSASDMWWRYPTFELGSYKQITNNIRYPDNPDDARCTPSNMCYALYHNNNKIGSNYIHPLPPVKPVCGARIGYFSTDENLLSFRSDLSNILY
jgi:hypothetical protein